MVRLFILQHDCGHRSFFRSRAGRMIGSVPLLSVLTSLPYHTWRRSMRASRLVGDLDRRGRGGEIGTMTVRGVSARPAGLKRFGYRLTASAGSVLAPPPLGFTSLIRPTITGDCRGLGKKSESTSTYQPAISAWAAMVCCVGWRSLLLIQPVDGVRQFAGCVLFYVQHQYEELLGSFFA